MKSAFIISSYPSNQQKIDYLKKTIESVKNIGFDIILTTNYPIKDEEIYNSVDYFIFDKVDVKSFTELGIILSWGWRSQINDNFIVSKRFDNAYHFDIYRCIYNAVGILNTLKYDFFYYLEGDSFLNQSELDNLISRRNEMFEKNKNMIFAQHHVDGAGGGYEMYQTMLFGGKPSYFLDKVKIPYDLQSWLTIENLNRNQLELHFYNELKSHSDEMLILNKDEFYMENCNQSKKSGEHFYSYPFYKDKNSDKIYLFTQNRFIEEMKILFFIDDEPFMNINVNPGWHHIREINYEIFLNKRLKEIVIIGETEIMNDEKLFTEEVVNIHKIMNEIEFI